jgi:hypothetical protein
MVTPMVPMTPQQVQDYRIERDMDKRNAPLSDADLDALFPSEGYKIVDVPADYVPIRTPARKLMATPASETPGGYMIPEENRQQVRTHHPVQPRLGVEHAHVPAVTHRCPRTVLTSLSLWAWACFCIDV